MMCQSLFSGKKYEKYFKISSAEIFTQSAKCKHVNQNVCKANHDYYFLVQKAGEIHVNHIVQQMKQNWLIPLHLQQ